MSNVPGIKEAPPKCRVPRKDKAKKVSLGFIMQGLPCLGQSPGLHSMGSGDLYKFLTERK